MYFVLDERLLRKNLLPPSCFSNLFLTPECLGEVTSITSFLSGSGPASPGHRTCGWEQRYASDGMCQSLQCAQGVMEVACNVDRNNLCNYTSVYGQMLHTYISILVSKCSLITILFTWNEEWVMLAAVQAGGAGARPGGRMM